MYSLLQSDGRDYNVVIKTVQCIHMAMMPLGFMPGN